MPYHLLLDISSLMYRAFFALPPSLSSAEGRPVNALRGYLDMAARLQNDLHPDEAIHVYDHDWRPAQRVAAYGGYKAHRPPEPEGLPSSLSFCARCSMPLVSGKLTRPDGRPTMRLG